MNQHFSEVLLGQSVPMHGIELYGIVSLCLFGLVFTGVFAWALLQRKSYLDRMSRVPLDLEEDAAARALTAGTSGPSKSPRAAAVPAANCLAVTNPSSQTSAAHE